MENILHYEDCLEWPENSIKQKMISINLKILTLEYKIVHTSILPSNHLHPHFRPTRERETTRLNFGTTLGPTLAVAAASSSKPLPLFFKLKEALSLLSSFPIYKLISSPLPPSDPPADLIAVRPTR